MLDCALSGEAGPSAPRVERTQILRKSLAVTVGTDSLSMGIERINTNYLSADKSAQFGVRVHR